MNPFSASPRPAVRRSERLQVPKSDNVNASTNCVSLSAGVSGSRSSNQHLSTGRGKRKSAVEAKGRKKDKGLANESKSSTKKNVDVMMTYGKVLSYPTCPSLPVVVTPERATSKPRRRNMQLIQRKGCKTQRDETLGGWFLEDGLNHIKSCHDGQLVSLIEKHGKPTFYGQEGKWQGTQARQELSQNWTFRSLCKIITGQQLSGKCAASIFNRLLRAVGASMEDQTNLNAQTILDIDADDAIEDRLRKPAGLSKAKVNSVVDLARHYRSGALSDEILFSDDEDEALRERLLQVKGIGPWSCDMFLMFYLHRPDVLPLGDLGVRKGTAKLFGVKGKGKGGNLCEKRDAELLHRLHQPFAPYRSLSTYYMWKVADTDLW